MSDHKCPDSGFDQGVRAERARLAARVEAERLPMPERAVFRTARGKRAGSECSETLEAYRKRTAPARHYNAALDAVLALLREGA